MNDYPKAHECTFLKPDATFNAKLPPFVTLARNGKYLAFTVEGDKTSYSLGISRDGWFCGFSTVAPENRSALVILKDPENGGFLTFRADTTPRLNLERIAGPACPPSGAFSSPVPQIIPQEQPPGRFVWSSNGLAAGFIQ